MGWKIKIKKILKYIGILILLITLILFFKLIYDGIKIYGGLTNRVNDKYLISKKENLLIYNTNILSEDSEKFISGKCVLIEGDRITKIFDYNDSIISGYKNKLNGSKKYLSPGFSDMHVHLWQSPNDLLLYVANGITQIRELVGQPDHVLWRNQINTGERIGPDLYVCSPRLGTFGSFEGWLMETTQGYWNVKTPEDAIEKVREIKKIGYDGIKIYSQITKENYFALIQEAKIQNLSVVGHIPWRVSLEEIFDSGQTDIVHLEEFMNALQREFDPNHKLWFGSFFKREAEFMNYVNKRSGAISKNLIKNDIYVTTTGWLTNSFVRQKFELDKVLTEVELDYVNPGISEWVSYTPSGLGWLPEVNRYKNPDNLSEEELEWEKKYWRTYGKACQVLATKMSKNGVKIMSGTDANIPPAVPGFSLHDEFKYLVESGMTTKQVLKSTTTIPAEWLGTKTGKIKVGFKANLVLLNSNPLDDIKNTKDINSVFLRGKLYDRELLDKLLKAVKDANDKSRNIPIDRYRQ